MKEIIMYNLTADIIGWIGNIGFILGGLLIAKKYVFGFHLNFIANLCYTVVGILTKMPSLVVCSVILAIINVYGIKKWKTN